MLESKQILNSYNFARNSDIVFSEILTHDQFNKLISYQMEWLTMTSLEFIMWMVLIISIIWAGYEDFE